MATDGEERVLLTEPESDTPVPEATVNEKAENEDFRMETLSAKLERFAEEIEEDAESNYKPPTEDPYTKAVKYMEMHNVMQIFQVSVSREWKYRFNSDCLSLICLFKFVMQIILKQANCFLS